MCVFVFCAVAKGRRWGGRERENFLFISRDVFRTTQTEDRERVGVCWAREKGRAVEMLLTVVSSAALLPLPFYLTVCLDPDDLFLAP